MKRFLFALLLLFFCFATAFFGFCRLEKSSLELIQKLSAAAELIKSGNISKAGDELKKVEKLQKENLSFSVFLDHTTLDALDSSLPSILEILSSGDSEKAFEEIQKSIAVLNDIIEEQKISIGNVL